MSKVNLLLIALLFSSYVLLAQDEPIETPPIVRIGDSIIYPPSYYPVSMSMMTMGDKIRDYCISNLVSVEGFASMCTDRMQQQFPQRSILSRPQKISGDLIWEIIRDEKEPIGELRIIILQIIDESTPKPKSKPKEVKSKKGDYKTSRMDF